MLFRLFTVLLLWYILAIGEWGLAVGSLFALENKDIPTAAQQAENPEIATADIERNVGVLVDENQLIAKTVGFANILSQEVFEKTGIRLFIIAKESLEGESVKELEDFYLRAKTPPYIALIFIKKEKKIDIIVSDTESEKLFDKQDVYWNYIVPLIPKSDKDITPQAISAFILNGFVEIADEVALAKNVELEHSFPKQNKGIEIAVRTILYCMVFVLLLLFTFAYFRRKS